MNGSERPVRPGLHPPWPAVRINNNLLSGASVSDAPRDSVDPLATALCRRRNLSELDRRCAVSRTRTISQGNAEPQQQNLLRRKRGNPSRSHAKPLGTVNSHVSAAAKFVPPLGCSHRFRNVLARPHKPPRG